MPEPTFKNIANKIINSILTAKFEIKIAVSWFTNNELFEPLLKKLEEDVQVKLIMVNDTININANNLNFQNFIDKKGILYLVNPSTLMHNKYCIIDDKEMFTGSYNWTNSAEIRNFENILYVNDASSIKLYQENFEELLNSGYMVSDISRVTPFAPQFIPDENIEVTEKHPSQNLSRTLSIIQTRNFYTEHQRGGSRRNQLYLGAIDTSSDGKYLAVINGSWIIKVWDTQTGQIAFTHPIEEVNYHGYPNSIKFSFDNKLLITSNQMQTFYTLSVPNKILKFKKKFNDLVSATAVNNSNEIFAFSSGDSVSLFDHIKKKPFERIDIPFRNCNTIEFILHDNVILIGTQNENLDSHLYSYSLNERRILNFYTSSELGIFSIRKLNESSFIASGGSSMFSIWDVDNPIPKITFSGHSGMVLSCDVNLKDGLVVSGGRDKTVNVWDLHTGALLQTIYEHNHTVLGVRFCPNSSKIFSCDEGGKILMHQYEYH